MSTTCRACGQPNTSRFPSLCGTCGLRALEWNKEQPHHVPNDWPLSATSWHDNLIGTYDNPTEWW